MYDETILNRYIVRVRINGNYTNAIIDTACSTTLLPLSIAEASGIKLNHTATVIVGGKTYKSTLYALPEVYIGDFAIAKTVAFAAEYDGMLGKSALIGQNILNNINITQLSHKANKIHFEFTPWILVKHKKYPFAFFFGGGDNGPKYPADLAADAYEEQ